MKSRIKKVISFNFIIIVIFFGYYFLNTRYDFKIKCPFYTLTNLYCPGCGITRCLFALIKLDFKSAFSYNPLIFIMIPFFLIYYLYLVYIYIFDKKNNIINKIPKCASYILLTIAILFAILRNTEMFRFLGPM